MAQQRLPDIRHENHAPADFGELVPSKQQKITAEIAEKAYRRGFQQGAHFVALMIEQKKALTHDAKCWAEQEIAQWRFEKPTTREIPPPPLNRVMP